MSKIEMKEIVVHEGIEYIIGEFDCPHCHEHHLLKCKSRKENPRMREKVRHWVE